MWRAASELKRTAAPSPSGRRAGARAPRAAGRAGAPRRATRCSFPIRGVRATPRALRFALLGRVRLASDLRACRRSRRLCRLGNVGSGLARCRAAPPRSDARSLAPGAMRVFSKLPPVGAEGSIKMQPERGATASGEPRGGSASQGADPQASGSERVSPRCALSLPLAFFLPTLSVSLHAPPRRGRHVASVQPDSSR